MLCRLAAACAAAFLACGALAPSFASSPARAQPADEQSEAPVYDPGPLTDGSPPPELPAESWILVDLDTGEVLTQHEPTLQHAPASTIKLLTGLALVDELDDPEATQEAAYEDMLVDGTKVGLVQQNDYTVDDLFHAMLMSSANDAAHALGEAAGGQDRAVELMNETAAELGLTGTTAANTSGLDDDGQVTTVQDLVRMGNAVLDEDYLMEVIAATEYDFPGAVNPDTDEKLPGYPIQNHTQVVGEVDGGLGLKNGYTSEAGGSFVAVVERDDRRLASAVLGSQTRTRDAAVDLIEWGFAQTAPEAAATLDLRTPAEAEATEEAAASAEADRAARAAAADEAAAAAKEASPAPGTLSSGALLWSGLGAAVLLAVITFWLLRRRSQAARARAGRAADRER